MGGGLCVGEGGEVQHLICSVTTISLWHNHGLSQDINTPSVGTRSFTNLTMPKKKHRCSEFALERCLTQGVDTTKTCVFCTLSPCTYTIATIDTTNIKQRE